MSFNLDKEAGKNAANNFWWFEGQLSKWNILSPYRTEEEYITGKDIIESMITDHGLIGAHTEVKAVRDNKFVKRNNNPRSSPDLSGTLDFEIWSNAWDQDNKPLPRHEWTDGWVPKMLHPERYNTEHIQVVKPTRLVFMLCRDEKCNYPYACVNFENYNELEKRLYDIAPFDLDDIPSPTLIDYWRNEKLNTPYNCWYVSFDQVKDLATITRILDVPLQADPEWNCPLRIQTARCVNLLNSCNNPSFDRRIEAKNARNAARAYNRERGLSEDAPLSHFTGFNIEKLPPWVKRLGEDDLPEWLLDIE